MLYHLIYPLYTFFTPLNIFRYVSFRAMAAVIVSLILSFAFGSLYIKMIKSKNIVQMIREDGPATHFKKHGTPTMGGLFVLLVTLLSTFISARLDNRFIAITILCILWLGFLGWMDDYLKVIKKSSKGVKARIKLIAQALFGLAVGCYLYFYPQNVDYATKVNIPFTKGATIDLGLFYILFVMFVFVASSNAVNLTDGLDGLAMGCVIISASTFGVFSYLVDIPKVAAYLKLIHIKDAGELCVMLAALIGAGLGFLWFNFYPAQIFLGDTGALFLGGVIGLVAIFIKKELLLPIVGGVFLAEVLSVILQVFYYKRYRKRIFRMAPLHHHFELKNMAEPKITVRFWLVNVILALIALSSLKIR